MILRRLEHKWNSTLREERMEWIGKLRRRVAAMVFTRVAELPLDEVKDPRRDRGKRWLLRDLLAAMVVGMAAGCRGFGDVEALTAEMGWPARRRLGLSRRVPDTTLHDMACRLDPNELRAMLHTQVQAAHRRKALEPQELPFHVASLDGEIRQQHRSERRVCAGVIPLWMAIRHSEACGLLPPRCRPAVPAYAWMPYRFPLAPTRWDISKSPSTAW